MRIALNGNQIRALEKWFEDDNLSNLSMDNRPLLVAIFGVDMPGGYQQFVWDGALLHDNGQFDHEPVDLDREMVSVEGRVIGWLAPDDTSNKEMDIAIVRATDGSTWLRWIGNDIFVTRFGAELDDEIQVGDHVSFWTNRREQQHYADAWSN